MIVYWNSDYVVAAEDFDTTRKSGWIVDSLALEPKAGIEVTAPRWLSTLELCKVHSEEYVEVGALGQTRRLAESQGFNWDPGLWTMACAHAGGMVAAAQFAMESGQNAGSL